MEKSNRARRRKSDTAKTDLKPSLAISGGQGVRREAESEGHEEKYRAVIEGRHPEDELVGQGWGKVEPAIGRRRRFSFTHHKQGDCGRHGTEEWCVTLRRTGRVFGGSGGSDPISESEVGSGALPVVGLLRGVC
jgi:hypothetical protein